MCVYRGVTTKGFLTIHVFLGHCKADEERNSLLLSSGCPHHLLDRVRPGSVSDCKNSPAPIQNCLPECLMRVLSRNTPLLRGALGGSSHAYTRPGNQGTTHSPFSFLSTIWFGALATSYKRHIRGPCSLLHLNLNRSRWSNQTCIISFLIS